MTLLRPETAGPGVASPDVLLASPLGPLYEELRQAVEHRPADFDFHDPSVAEQKEQLGPMIKPNQTPADAWVWLPQGDAPGYIVITDYSESEAFKGDNTIRELHTYMRWVQRAERLGLSPALSEAGISVAEHLDPDTGRRSYIMQFPGAEAFCEGVGRAVDAGLAHVRYAVAQNSGPFGYPELASSLADGRMLVSPLAKDGVDFKQLKFYLHDLLSHGLAHLGLAPEVADRMFGLGTIADEQAKRGSQKLANIVGTMIEECVSIQALNEWHNSPNTALYRFKLTQEETPSPGEIQHKYMRALGAAATGR